MNNEKTITAVIAFAVAFIFSTGLVRIFVPPPLVSQKAVIVQNNLNAEALEEFLMQDIRNGYVRDYTNGGGRAASTAEYYRASSQLDATRFSPEFQRAWSEHMTAWRQMGQLVNDLPVDGNLNYYRIDGDIDRTWAKVLQIARSEGARVKDF